MSAILHEFQGFKDFKDSRILRIPANLAPDSEVNSQATAASEFPLSSRPATLARVNVESLVRPFSW